MSLASKDRGVDEAQPPQHGSHRQPLQASQSAKSDSRSDRLSDIRHPKLQVAHHVQACDRRITGAAFQPDILPTLGAIVLTEFPHFRL